MIRKIAQRFSLAILLVAGAAQTAFAGDSLTIGTAGTAGSYYSMGGAMAMQLEQGMESVDRVTAQVTAGTIENCRLLQAGELDLALANASVVFQAVQGQGIFRKRLPKLRTLFWCHRSVNYLVTMKSAGYASFKDLLGKRVAVGAPGSGTTSNVFALFKHHGLDVRKDIKPLFISTKEAIDALKDGRADGIFISGGIPMGSLKALSVIKEIRILPFPEEDLRALNATNPGIVKVIVPAGTYDGVDYDVVTMGVATTFIGSSDIPADRIKAVLGTLEAKMGWFGDNVHKSFRQYRFAPDVSQIAPLHEGAVAYYRERGLMK